MTCAVTILAIGDEHIDEFNKTFNNFDYTDLYVLTDDEDKITNQNSIKIKTHSEFNFNNKLIPIERAFKKHDVVISLDSDISFKQNFDFGQLDTLEDGLYVNWMGNVQKHKDQKISINQIMNNNSSFDDLNRYGQSLIKCGANMNNISFFDEFIFLIKLTNEDDKINFIKNWKYVNDFTLEGQPKDRHTNLLKGSLESLIITYSCHLSNIKIFDNSQIFRNLYHSIVHYGSKNINKTML